jgi:outer membrane cobalamin receptor
MMRTMRLSACVLLFSATVRAEPADLEALLAQTVVTTPSKSAEAATVAPATTSVITAEDLRRFGVRSLDEAINYLSLGMVTTDPQHAVEIGSRGVLLTADYGNHVLLLVDGHALNEPWDGTAYFERGAGIPFELVDHIEVTLGPGSVLYGSQAMLGVINIVTKRAKDYGGVHVIGEGELAAGSRRDGTPWSQGLGTGYRVAGGFGRELRLFGVPAETTLQIEYYRQHGPAFEYGPQAVDPPKSFGPHAEPGVWGGVVRNAYFTEVPTAYGRLAIGDFEMFGRVGMYRRGTPYLDSIVSDAGDFDDPRSFERDRFANVELRHRASVSASLQVRSRLYADVDEYAWQNVTSAEADCPGTMASGCRRNLVGTGRALGGEVNGSFDWFQTGRFVTLLGVDAKLRDVRSSQEIRDNATGRISGAGGQYGSHTDGTFAVYLEQSANPLPWLTLNAGVRADHDPRFGGRFSPRGAVGVTPWQNGQIKAVYSEAFRAPSAYELEYYDPSDVIAAPHLRPETVRSVELSVEQRFWTQHFLFGVFRTSWNDMVLQELVSDAERNAAIASGQLSPDATDAYQYRNVATIENYGWNASWDGSALEGSLHYGMNLTEAFSRQNDPLSTEACGAPSHSCPLTVGPSLFGNARIAYDLPNALPTIGVAAQAQARRPADRAFDGGFSVLPYAPPLLVLRTTVSGAVPSVKGLSYRASAAYSFASRGPYVVGPNLYAADATTRAELNPVTRISGFAGLEYTFDP